MDILSLAEENSLISLSVVLAVGLLQGMILGRGIRQRFPSLKVHARAVSLILLVLFAINMIASIINFATPKKLALDNIVLPAAIEEWPALILGVLGLDAGFGAALAVFVSITLILLFRFSQLPSAARYFIFGLSVITVSVFFVARFTDYVPTVFQIILYSFYQFGVMVGVYVITRRKEKNVFSELEDSF